MGSHTPLLLLALCTGVALASTHSFLQHYTLQGWEYEEWEGLVLGR